MMRPSDAKFSVRSREMWREIKVPWMDSTSEYIPFRVSFCFVPQIATYHAKLREVETLRSIKITLDTTLRGLNKLLAMDNDVRHLLV